MLRRRHDHLSHRRLRLRLRRLVPMDMKRRQRRGAAADHRVSVPQLHGDLPVDVRIGLLNGDTLAFPTRAPLLCWDIGPQPPGWALGVGGVRSPESFHAPILSSPTSPGESKQRLPRTPPTSEHDAHEYQLRWQYTR